MGVVGDYRRGRPPDGGLALAVFYMVPRVPLLLLISSLKERWSRKPLRFACIHLVLDAFNETRERDG